MQLNEPPNKITLTTPAALISQCSCFQIDVTTENRLGWVESVCRARITASEGRGIDEALYMHMPRGCSMLHGGTWIVVLSKYVIFSSVTISEKYWHDLAIRQEKLTKFSFAQKRNTPQQRWFSFEPRERPWNN